jgi:hypothetical protein
MSSFMNNDIPPVMPQMDYMADDRAARLQNMCMMMIDGAPVYKFDHVANIKINGTPYFTVYRRYNTIYEFVVEDYRGEFHVFMNEPIRSIVAKLLCLSNQEHNDMAVAYATSYGHNTPLYGDDVINMPLSVVQNRFVGVNVNLYNVLWSYQEACDYCNNVLNRMPEPEPVPEPVQSMPSPEMGNATKSLSETFNDILNSHVQYNDEDGPSVVRLSVFIPDKVQMTPVRAAADKKDMSMRHQDIKKRRAEAVAAAKAVVAAEAAVAEAAKAVAAGEAAVASAIASAMSNVTAGEKKTKKRRREVSPERTSVDKKEYNLRRNKRRASNM